MANMFGPLSGWGSGLGNVLTYAFWFLVFLVIAATITTMVVLFIAKKTQRKIIEINMMNKRVRIFSGRDKKNKVNGIKQFWVGKFKRFLPEFQQKSVFVKGKQDVLFLLTDNNGMHHSARIPSYEDLRRWYMITEGVDIATSKEHKALEPIYFLPAPHEDLDWLAGQCVESEKEFSVNHWWQSPTVAYIATGFICFMIIIVTQILQKKL